MNQLEFTKPDGKPVVLDTDQAMSVSPKGDATELVFPFPLGRVTVAEAYDAVLYRIAEGHRKAGA